jgi:hypothetical protein
VQAVGDTNLVADGLPRFRHCAGMRGQASVLALRNNQRSGSSQTTQSSGLKAVPKARHKAVPKAAAAATKAAASRGSKAVTREPTSSSSQRRRSHHASRDRPTADDGSPTIRGNRWPAKESVCCR